MSEPPLRPGCEDVASPADARNRRRANVWLFATMALYLGASATVRWRAGLPAFVPWAAITVLLGMAVATVRAYRRFLRGADELVRRIQTDALAVGFSVGAVVGLAYPLLETLGAPRLGAAAGFVAMMLAWGLASWLGARRYDGGS